MKNTKFIVKIDRGSTHTPEYVQRIDLTPIQTTPNRKLALVNGKIHSRGCRQIYPEFPLQPGASFRASHCLASDQRSDGQKMRWLLPLVR